MGFKWHEMKEDNVSFKINSIQIDTKTLYNHSPFKMWVCKKLDINPMPEYKTEIIFGVSNINPLMPHDVIVFKLDESAVKFRVVVHDGTLIHALSITNHNEKVCISSDATCYILYNLHLKD